MAQEPKDVEVEGAIRRLQKARIAGPVFKWDSDLVPEYKSGTHTITGDWSILAAVTIDEINILELEQERRRKLVRNER